MYFGAPDEAADWFATQGYMYSPMEAGLVSDWMLDLVSTSFYKPSKPKVHSRSGLQACWTCSAQPPATEDCNASGTA